MRYLPFEQQKQGLTKRLWPWEIQPSRLRETIILVIGASDRPKALGNCIQENMRRRVLIAKNWLYIWTLRRLLTPRANMNAPIRDDFHRSSRKPMRRHFVSGFPRALLSRISQVKSSGVEIGETANFEQKFAFQFKKKKKKWKKLVCYQLNLGIKYFLES